MGKPYVCNFFKLEELLPQLVFEKLAADNKLHRGWLMMDERILRTADALRAWFGPLTVNNWHSSGTFQARGLRVPGQRLYSPTSQHSYGRALDISSSTVSAEQMRRVVIGSPREFPLITRIEADVPWLHVDCANAQPIEIFRP